MSKRTVHLTAWVLEALRLHKTRHAFEKDRAENLWIVQRLMLRPEDGGPTYAGTVDHALKEVLKRASMPDVRVHDLRRTAATLLVTRGTHTEFVQVLLEHFTVTLTMDTYSRALPALSRGVADEMRDMFHEEWRRRTVTR
jgi:integrase